MSQTRYISPHFTLTRIARLSYQMLGQSCQDNLKQFIHILTFTSITPDDIVKNCSLSYIYRHYAYEDLVKYVPNFYDCGPVLESATQNPKRCAIVGNFFSDC